MKKDGKNAVQPKALNKNDSKNISSGSIIDNYDGTYDVYGDKSEVNLGSYLSLEDAQQAAKDWGVSSDIM